MSEYFSHDYSARNDLKMKKLFMSEGLAGIGLYWCLVEMLYEKGGYIELDYVPIIAFDLRTTEEVVNNVISGFELFDKNETHFFSNSVLERLNLRAEKSEKARKSIEARWNKVRKNNESNTDEIRTYNDSNTIKGKKRKEKESESKVDEKESVKKNTASRFTPPTFDEVQSYCNERKNSIDVEHFIAHYTANGWKQSNGNPIKDWKACVITWEKRDKERQKPVQKKQAQEETTPWDDLV